MSAELLKIEDLQVVFPTRTGRSIAADGVSFSIRRGEIFGIVGESGCGKSITSLSILRLIAPPGQISRGRILYEGEDLLTITEREMQQRIRGNEIAMIFQEPMTSLNPLFTIGEQIMEPLRLHQKLSRRAAAERAVEMLHAVGIPLPLKRMGEYPHTLSGGMRQRAMIAMAMCCDPKLLIADEPTTALDVTTQAQILKLMKELKEQRQSSILLISHDLGVVANMCDRIAVMYCGKVVEEGSTREILKNPLHPYSRGLIESIPSVRESRATLYSIPGTVPVNTGDIPGCPFAARCNRCTERCIREAPSMRPFGADHAVSCHYPGGEDHG
ncbi:MAG: ABC transporter ATP-binding protein [Ruminococcaceae bacterium]|nr:ABC transporter ATP-binding protein [Oscillospiraceae bacterium]